MNSNEIEIQKTINTYVDGYLKAEKKLIQKAFHSDTVLYCVESNQIVKTEMKAWLLNIDDRKVKNDFRNAELLIKNINITDQISSAKIELLFEKFKYTDYLSLLKINGEWIIVRENLFS